MVDALTLSLRLVTLVIVGGCMLVASHKIDQWERLNGYPYGKLCDVYNSCQLIENRNAIENALDREFSK